MAVIAEQFLELREDIIGFFDSCIEENSNKLVLSVSAFIESEWFLICCLKFTPSLEIYSHFLS